jgi:hypothetical protein
MPRKTQTGEIRPGRLREKVKAGVYDPGAVLVWLRKQKYISEKLANWLTRFNLEQHEIRAERDRKIREEKEKNQLKKLKKIFRPK